MSVRVMSLHLPSCRLVSLCFVSFSFPLHTPCFHFCLCHAPFSSLCFPFIFRCFLGMATSYSSPHFLALPCICSPVFPAQKTHGFCSVFAKRTSSFGPRRQETQTSKEPAGGIEPGTSETSASHRGGVGGGVILYPLLGARHAEQCRRTL